MRVNGLRRALVGSFCAFGGLAGCNRDVGGDPASAAPAPDTRRVELKSQAELAAARSEGIRRGDVVEAGAPLVEAERARLDRIRRASSAPAGPVGAVRSDILIVNETTLTAAEVLYPMRRRLAEILADVTSPGAADKRTREQIESLVRQQVQQEIGAVLVYEEAMASLADEPKKSLEKAVARDIDLLVTRDFGGSIARFGKHLEEFGLTLDKYREATQRHVVVRSYTRDVLMPQVNVRRDELLDFYRSNREAYSTPETRELLILEAPYAAFLPDGVRWEAASGEARARARLAAVRHIRAAKTALESRSFEDVAREFSRGLRAEEGGSWGMIGKPLEEPYDDLSARIFQFSPGQTSDTIETERGWFIVRCGTVNSAKTFTFEEAQDKIRDDLKQRRFDKLASEHVRKLADKATVTSLEAFIKSIAKAALTRRWEPTAADVE
jgi:PPIC-type PPIASE domain